MIDESFGQVDVRNRKVMIVVELRRYFEEANGKEREAVLIVRRRTKFFGRYERKLKDRRKEKKRGMTREKKEKEGSL